MDVIQPLEHINHDVDSFRTRQVDAASQKLSQRLPRHESHCEKVPGLITQLKRVALKDSDHIGVGNL